MQRLLALALALAACVPALDVPPTAQITCSASQPCPAGFTCRENIGRCIANEKLGEAAPALSGAVRIAPAVARAGQVLTVAFDLDRPLLKAPALQATIASKVVAFAASAATDSHYEFTYPVTAESPEGAAELRVELVGTSGATAPDVLLGTIAIDRTAPSVTRFDVLPPIARLDASLVFTLDVSEPLAEPPTLTATPPLDLGAPEKLSDTEFRWKRTVLASDVAGTYDATFAMTDLAGNPASGSAGTFPVDNAPPVATDIEVAPAVAIPGTLVVADLTCTDALAAPPEFFAGDTRMTLDATVEAPKYRATWRVPADALDGPLAVSARIEDVAHNVSYAALGKVVVDTVPPALAAPVALERSDGLPGARSGTTLTVNRTNPYGDPKPVQARVAFVLTEVVPTPPVVKIGAKMMTLEHQEALSFGYSYAPDGTETEGAAAVTAVATDAAGNAATLDLGTIVFDFTPPARFDPALLTYVRGPTESIYRVSGAPGAAPANHHLRVYADAATGFAHMAAEAPVLADGSVPPTLAPGDLPTVYASLVDPAGNEGAAVALSRVEWRATFDRRASGDDRTNPHSAFHGDANPPDRPESGRAELATDEYEGLAPNASQPFTSAHSPAQWAQRRFDRPVSRGFPRMAFDAARQELALFGSGEGAPLGDTWAFDGEGWTDRTPSGSSPIGRLQPALAYDDARGRLVLFGGRPLTGAVNDTWEWDGRAWSQRRLATSPPAVANPLAAWDGHRVLLVANGLWAFDGAAWTSLGSLPPELAVIGPTGAAAWDSARGRLLVMVRQNDGTGATQGWEWDGATWTRIATNGLPASCFGALAYDPVRHVTVWFTGSCQTAGSATWEWDGTAWTALTAPGPTPGRGAALAWDPVRRRVILYDTTDLWTLANGQWVRLTASGTPSARTQAAMVYDAARAVSVLFGGTNPTTGQVSGDTWEWTGSRWVNRAPPSGPSPRAGHAMAFDGTRTLLFGPGSELWSWDGAGWTNLTPTPLPAAWPGGRAGHAMAWDSARHVLVVTGGQDPLTNAAVTDTWEWNGTTWRRGSKTGPPANGYAAMAYDPLRQRTVLFGGLDASGPTNATWAWDGTSWTALNPANPPPARRGAAMAFDSDRGLLVLSGGTSTPDTWTFDGTAWTALETAATPDQLDFPALAYDSGRRRMVLFGGGSSSGVPLAGTWELSLPSRPSLDWDVRTSGAISMGAGGKLDGTLVAFEVTATLGGEGGAVLEAWDRHAAGGLGAWRALASNTAAVDAPRPVQAVLTVSASDDLSGLFVGDLVRLRVRAANVAAAGRTALGASGLAVAMTYVRR